MAKKLFDFAIGNPPYNDDFDKSGDNGNFGTPVYHTFMDAANDVADKVELIHPARFLFNAGSTPKTWNQKMLNDPHFKVLHYEEDARKVFSNTEIKGGVAITYRDPEKSFGPIQVFTKYPELNGILHKIPEGCDRLSTIFYIQTKFDLNALYGDHPEYSSFIGSDGKDKRFRSNSFTKVPAFTEERSDNSDIRVIGVINNKRCYRFIRKRYVDISQESLYKWTVIIPTASGSGVFGETITPPTVLEPGTGYTQTFIGIGAFDDESDATALDKYLRTKFLRALMGVYKTTQHITPEVFRMVPLQDFSSSSDIDWSVSVHEIDLQLYRKYGLSVEEINFIEANVKEMI